MSDKNPVYLLDSNILITAKRAYYAFDLCPGFWEALARAHDSAQLFSTKRVLNELKSGKDDLYDWATKVVPASFFLDDSEADVIAEFSPMMNWVQAAGFNQAAKQDFASDADGWLIACAKARGFTLVTEEQYVSNAIKRVPMPNVCQEFGVPHITTFEMLRGIAATFELRS